MAIRLSVLSDNNHSCWNCFGISASAVAENDGFVLHKAIPPRMHGNCECAQWQCDWGAPYFLVLSQEEKDLFGKKPNRTNIYPVLSDRRAMFHATPTRNIRSIMKRGLLSKQDPGVRRGHGFLGLESWLRYTGSLRAAEKHAPDKEDWSIIPIAYEGMILETCMDLYPDRLLRLFELIPASIGCIRMREDGESYVFRKHIHLPLDRNRMPTKQPLAWAKSAVLSWWLRDKC